MPARPDRQRLAAALPAVLACLVALAGACGPATAGPQQPPQAPAVRLSLPQAQALAQQALGKGQPRTALTLSEGLIAANPENGHAHFIRARALGQLAQYRTGQHAAARAYRTARTDVQRFEAAKLAAELAFADERLTASQLWLRRAVHYAPSDDVRRDYVTAFRNVRHRNPLSFNLRFSITPSDNVNNGANSPWNLIEGSPLVGALSPSAQAIPGIVAKTDMIGAYRIHQAEGVETRLTGRVLSNEVRLNNPVAGISGSDISSLRAQLGVAHVWAPGKDGYWRFELNGGRTWYGRAPYYDFAGVGISRVQKLGERLSLSLGTHFEEQNGRRVAGSRDASVWSAVAGLAWGLTGGGSLRADLLYRDIDSDGVNRTSRQWSAQMSYAMGRSIGPAKISFTLGHSTLDYDEYWVITPVPGGRVDDSWFGGATASFAGWSYMGFVPELSLTAERSRSNISRFDVDLSAISLGIRSEF